MSKRSFTAIALLLFTLISADLFGSDVSTARPKFRSLPLAFEKNVGQASSDYRYLVRRGGIAAYFKDGSVEVRLPGGSGRTRGLSIKFKNAGDVKPEGEDLGTGRTNYLLGDKPERWVQNVPQFERLRYSRLYPGIDLLFYGSGSTLEHDFVLAAGADPGQISFRIEKAKRIGIAQDGALEMGVEGAMLRFEKPVAYQTIDGKRKSVPARFTRRGRTIGFSVGEYDRNLPLVIDPVLTFATYLDGSMNDQINAVATDPAGNIYVAGSTMSADFPTTQGVVQPVVPCAGTPGAYCFGSSFVSKLDATGQHLLFSTYLGGAANPGGTSAHSIAVDANGNVIIGGITGGMDFPQAGNLISRVPIGWTAESHFLVSLKSDGSAFNFSGLVGGGSALVTKDAVTVDAQRNVYLAGQTADQGFPTTAGVISTTNPGYPYDTTFVTKVDPTGNLLYSTFIPGNATYDPATHNNEFRISGIAVDANGSATIGGDAAKGLPTTPGTISPTFPNAQLYNARNGYLLKLNPTASSITFATYLPEVDSLQAFAADPNGDFYLTGMTNSTQLYVSANAYQKTVSPGQHCVCGYGYILKVKNDGTSILAGSYLTGTPDSGNGGTQFRSLALDSHSNVFVAGSTGSSDFPLYLPLQSDLSTVTLGFAAGEGVAELSSDLSTLRFGSFLHGSTSGTYFTGAAMGPDDRPVVVGTTHANDFPTMAGSYQQTAPPPNPYAGYIHSVIAEIDISTAAASVCLDTSRVDFGPALVNTANVRSFNVTNCGNAPLVLSSLVSSDPSVTASQTCGSIAPGGSCAVTMTFTPTQEGNVYGTLTLTDNAAVGKQYIAFSGFGGKPRFSAVSSFDIGDALVGTSTAPAFVGIFNQGSGPLSIMSVSTTGPFTAESACTSAVQPNGGCAVRITFSPVQAGAAAGALSITDNADGSPHVVMLQGNGITTYPVPEITLVNAIKSTDDKPVVLVRGNDFFSGSTVYWNGQARPTTLLGPSLLSAVLSAGDASTVGEARINVVTSAPGGGTSNTYTVPIYGHLDQITTKQMVFEKTSAVLYATVSSLSPTYANSVVTIDPVTMTVLRTLHSGGGPNQLAVSDDGSLLYVGLDDDRKVAQLSLPGGSVNFVVGLGVEDSFNTAMVANSLIVLPGNPHAWVVSKCGVGFWPCGREIAVFDDNVQRANPYTQTQLAPDSMTFVGSNAQKLYATTLSQSPPTFYEFAISATGITLTSSSTDCSGNGVGGAPLASDGAYIYAANGQVIDPTARTVVKTFSSPDSWLRTMALDPFNSRIYFSNYGYPFRQLMAMDRTTSQELGTISLDDGYDAAALFRWGPKGLVVQEPFSILFFETSLTGVSSTVGVSPAALDFGSQMVSSTSTKTITLTNTGTIALGVGGVVAAGAEFTVTHNCPASLSVGASCTLTVKFSPTSAGNRTGTITITHEAIGSPLVMTVRGLATDFALSQPSGSATVNAGQAATYNLQLTGTTGLSGNALLSCTGAPTAATCTVSPASVNLLGGGSVDLTVSVTTTARSTASAALRHSHSGGVPATWMLFAGIFGTVFVCASRKAQVRAAAACVTVVLMLGLGSCGGGGNSGGGNPPPVTGTPAGSYTLTVHATVNGTSRTIPLSLTVK